MNDIAAAVPVPAAPNGAAPRTSALDAGTAPPAMRFDPANPNLALWLRHEPTDPSATKPFDTGTFSGTAVNGTYVAKRLTEEFGPLGLGWWVEVLASDFVDGAPVVGEDGRVVGHTRVHVARIALHLRHADGTLGRSEQFGQTVFARHTARRGWTTDEDAPKKSLTDALAKAASWLGVAADIHLGRWDDARYVEERRDGEARERTARGAKADALEADGLRRCAAEAEAAIAAAGTDEAFLAARGGASALRQPLERLGLRAELKRLAAAVRTAEARLSAAGGGTGIEKVGRAPAPPNGGAGDEDAPPPPADAPIDALAAHARAVVRTLEGAATPDEVARARAQASALRPRLRAAGLAEPLAVLADAERSAASRFAPAEAAPSPPRRPAGGNGSAATQARTGTAPIGSERGARRA